MLAKLQELYAASAVYPEHYTQYPVSVQDATWNTQTFVQFWHRVRKPLTIVATLCNLVFASYANFASHSLTTAVVLDHAFSLLAFSTLVECASKSGTVWFNQSPHPIANWPLRNWRWLANCSQWCDRHRHVQFAGDVVLFACLLTCTLFGAFNSTFVFFTWAMLLVTSVVDGVRFYTVMQPWLVCMSAFLFPDTVTGMRLVCGGVYFASGATKLFNKEYYSGVAPTFLAPPMRVLHEMLGIRSLVLDHIIYGAGVAAEMVLGITLLLATLMNIPAFWMSCMRLVDFSFHLYIIGLLRLWHLPNWNSLCMVLTSIALINEPQLLSGPFSLHSLALVILFVVWPQLVYIGHGFGYLSHHYFCGVYEGDCRLLVRKDEVQNAFALQHAAERATEDAEAKYPDATKEFLEQITKQQQTDILRRLSLPLPDENENENKSVSAQELLVQFTVLLDTSFYERHLTLIRPACNEPYVYDLQAYIAEFWEFYNRSLVQAKHPLLIVVKHWTHNGYENRIIPL